MSARIENVESGGPSGVGGAADPADLDVERQQNRGVGDPAYNVTSRRRPRWIERPTDLEPRGQRPRLQLDHPNQFAVVLILVLLLVLSFALQTARAEERPTHEVILVIGAPGEESYQNGFGSAAEQWRGACQRAKAKLTVIGLDASSVGGPTDRDRIHTALAALDAKAAVPAWLVYIGHGSFDGRQAWWNLRGPDVSGEELAQWLKPLTGRTLIVVHGGSASGPFIPLLSAPGRIIITATRSGNEVNYARFGERFAAAIASSRADLDQDGETSVLEAFLQASKDAQLLYSENGRMATEHALIDDNGDKLGTPSDWFDGVRVVKRPAGNTAAADGFRAHQIALIEAANAPTLTAEQRQRRDALEQKLESIRGRRASMPEAEYLNRIERVLRELGELYR